MKELIPGLPEEIGLQCLMRVHHRNFRLLGRVCRRWKQAIESPLFHHLRRSSGLSHPLIIFFQAAMSSSLSSIRLVSFYPNSGDCSPFPPIPFSTGGVPLCCGLAASNLHLVIVAYSPSTAVYVYSFLSSTWARGAPMPAPARSSFACAASSNNQIFIAGGHDEDMKALKSAMVYNISKDEWTVLPGMTRRRNWCTGVFVDGKAGGTFAVVGGSCTSRHGRVQEGMEVFDVEKWQWRAVVEEVVEKRNWSRRCVAGGDGRVYMCGVRERMLVVNEEGKEWREVAELPEDARVDAYMVGSGVGLMMINKTFRDGDWVTAAHVLELKEGPAIEWRRVEVPKEYSCCLLNECFIDI